MWSLVIVLAALKGAAFAVRADLSLRQSVTSTDGGGQQGKAEYNGECTTKHSVLVRLRARQLMR